MELTKQEDTLFNKPSILINIAHSLDISLNSLKVYNYVIRELFKANIELNTTIETTFKDIAKKALGYNANYSSLEILDYLIELRDTTLNTKTFNYKRNDWKDKLITSLLASITYCELDNTVKLEISKGLRDLILKYKDTFAKLDLVEMKAIKSKHTLKLYELFKDYSYHRNHKMNVSLEDLFHFLNIPKDAKYRENISIFNRNILKKAIEEIGKISYMKVEYKYFRANKSNPAAYYQFLIDDPDRFSFNLFKESMIEYCQKVNMNVSWNYKKSKYYLEDIKAKNSEKLNTMFINCDNGNTLESEKAIELWQTIFHEANYNTLDFFEKLNCDILKFQTIYDTLKNRKKENKKIIKQDDETEIILHENQSTIEDFLY